MKEIECFISGKVTMVNYREFAKKWATTLGLKGYAENTADYRVHVVAQGTEHNLNKFLDHLRKGPFNATVRNIDVAWHDAEAEYEGFTIEY